MTEDLMPSGYLGRGLRAFPLPPWWDVPGGTCRWCNTAFEGYTNLKMLARRRWHRDCNTEFAIARNCSIAINELLRKQNDLCASCGGCEWDRKWGKTYSLRREYGTYEQPMEAGYGYFCRLEAAWEVDHIFPLWLVDRTKPWAEQIVSWKIGNLQALCRTCHKAKSKREAGQRAKLKRLTKPQQPFVTEKGLPF